MITDERLDLEFAYTTWNDSCRDLRDIERCCRRPRDHEGDHASGFGSKRVRWPR